MARNPHPRLARFVRTDSNAPAGKVIVGRVYDGPISEIDKTVHIVIRKGDIRAIREFLDKLEAEVVVGR
jgi:hypothetical protein